MGNFVSKGINKLNRLVSIVTDSSADTAKAVAGVQFGALAYFAPVFDVSGRFISTCLGNIVKVCWAKTGETAKILRGHTARVTCIRESPNSSSMLYSSSLDGTIILWDINTGRVVNRYNIGVPIYSFVCVVSNNKQTTCYMSTYYDGARVKNKGKTVKLTHHVKSKLMRATLMPSAKVSTVLECDGPIRCLSSSSSPSCIVHFSEGSNLYHLLDDKKIVKVRHDKVITALASYGDEVAVGVDNGNIFRYKIDDILPSETSNRHTITTLDEEKEPQNRVMMHTMNGNSIFDLQIPVVTWSWHASSVLCLTYTTDGSHLLSGGLESVLVRWQVSTGNNYFLPRLGGHVLGIAQSSDASMIAVLLSNSCVMVLQSGTQALLSQIYSVHPAPPHAVHGLVTRNDWPCDPCLKNKSERRLVPLSSLDNHVYLPYYEGGVQVLSRDRVLHTYTVASAPQVHLTSHSDKDQGVSWSRVRLTLSHLVVGRISNDTVMAVAEHREFPGSADVAAVVEHNLSVWAQSQADVVNECKIKDPHRGGIANVHVCGKHGRLISIGYDGVYHVYERTGATSSSSRPSWSCTCAVVYASHVECRSVASCVSQDESVLVICADRMLYLFDIANSMLVKSVSLPLNAVSAAFVGLTHCCIVMDGGSKQSTNIMLYDVLNLAPKWTTIIENSCAHGVVANAEHACVLLYSKRSSDSQIKGSVDSTPYIYPPSPLLHDKTAVYNEVMHPYVSTVLSFSIASPAFTSRYDAERGTKIIGMCWTGEMLTLLDDNDESRQWDPVKGAVVVTEIEAEVSSLSISNQKQTAVADLFAANTPIEPMDIVIPVPTEASTTTNNNKSLDQLFNVPNHAIPSLSMVYDSYMNSIMGRSEM